MEELALEYLQNKQKIKELLQRQVIIMDTLTGAGHRPSVQYKLPNGDVVTMKDNYVNKAGFPTNAIFRPLQVERWTIE